MPTTYTALSLGPIYKTLQKARSTKAIWTASYLFSFLMREFILSISDSDRKNILLPYSDEVNGKKPLEEKYQVGLFPDRLIYKGEINDIERKIASVKDKFVNEINKSLVKEKKEDIKKYIHQFINFHHICVELDENSLKDKGSSVIHKINTLFDTAELKNNLISKPDNEFLETFFEMYEPRYNSLLENEFNNARDKRFKSTAEIATAEFSEEDFYTNAANLIKRDKENDQEDYYDQIKKGADKLIKNYQKYIAVIQADGDNMGDFIKELYKDKEKAEALVKQFSKNLLSFAIEAVELIKERNGTPVYAGGDDLLYFMPVAKTKYAKNINFTEIDSTILSLIDELDKIFCKYFTEYNEEGIDFQSIIAGLNKKPSMSYGVSVSYYKFPLNEALALGVNQLFYQAKNTTKKDAVSYSILKHSGQTFGTTFHKKDASYKSFKHIISEQVTDADFIRGVIHKLAELEAVFLGIGNENDKDERDKMLDNFFENNFNESVHTIKNGDQKELIPFLKHTKQLFKDVYSEECSQKTKEPLSPKELNRWRLEKIYAALRFFEFITNNEERP